MIRKFPLICVTVLISLSIFSFLINQAINVVGSLEKTGHLFYDLKHVGRQQSYPACADMSKFHRIIQAEEILNVQYALKYQQKVNTNAIRCGNHRTISNILMKSKIQAWENCAEEITPAKRRLHFFMQNLCDMQQRANDCFSKSSISRLNCLNPSNNESNHTRRGVVFTGKTKHFKSIYQSIVALRSVSRTDMTRPEVFPVEVWVSPLAVSLCRDVFMDPEHSPVNIHCKALPIGVTSFASKFHTLLGTTLQEVLFLDADNLVVRDLAELFSGAGFRDTGAVLWPDIWASTCDLSGELPHLSGTVCKEEFVLFSAQFSDLKWSLERKYAQETESGQMVLNLDRHRGLVDMGRRMLEDPFFRRVFNGDKDIFRFVFLLTRTPFHYVQEPPGYSVDDLGRRDCLVQFHHHNSSEGQLPMFFHQLKTRSPSAFGRYVRTLPSHRADPAVCLRITLDYSPLPPQDAVQKEWFRAGQAGAVQTPRGDKYLLETPSDGAELVSFADNLFRAVDSHWEQSGFKVRCERLGVIEKYFFIVCTTACVAMCVCMLFVAFYFVNLFKFVRLKWL